MKHLTKLGMLMSMLAVMSMSARAQSFAESGDSLIFRYFDSVIFHDVYAGTVSEETWPVPEGMLRLNNSRYARPMDKSDLAQMGDTLRLDVLLEPLCDNYDRIANVSLTLQPKGTTYYNDVDAGYLGRLGSTDPNIRRIEIGRFITPFMDKNKTPDAVPYTWDVSWLVPMFHDHVLLDTTDIWIELTVEGVPYAANTQVSGCSGRNDVFKASATLVSSRRNTTNDEVSCLEQCVVQPFVYQRYLNSYNASHTDEPGTTTAHYTVHVDEPLNDAMFLFVNSNHGANSGGEEYERRIHYVFVNEWMAMVYRPGRESCEPYRQYNTQANGIYGTRAKTDEEWQSFSNWCPGDRIDNRIIHLGALEPGDYDFRMLVPDAVFNGNEGYFPFSLTFFGLKEGQFNGIDELQFAEGTSQQGSMNLQRNGDIVTLTGNGIGEVVRWHLMDMQGQRLMVQPGQVPVINMSGHQTGVYVIVTEMSDGHVEVYKFFK